MLRLVPLRFNPHYLFFFVLMGLCFTSKAQLPDPYTGFQDPIFSFRTFGTPSVPFSCTGASFDFQEVFIGESASRTLLIRNEGSGLLRIQSLEVVGSSNFSVAPALSSTDEPILLGEGEELMFTVTYEPITAGDHEAQVVVHHNASPSSPCSFKVEGSARQMLPGTLDVLYVGDDITFPITCGETTLEFPDVPVGETSTQTIIVRNIGDAPLTIVNYAFSGSTDFSLLFSPTPVPFTLAPGEEIVFTLGFTPSSPGEKEGYITFYTKDRKCTFPLEGGGLDDGEPFISIFDPDGNPVSCGGSIYFDLSETNPGPVIFGFYFTFRNYGTEDLLVSGSASIEGVPGSNVPIDMFTVESLRILKR
ncbi:MAG: choice-of-anchor D domain-containing protein [Bacteroidota bacterium]